MLALIRPGPKRRRWLGWPAQIEGSFFGGESK